MEAGRRVVVVLAMLRENQRMADIDLSRKFPDMQPFEHPAYRIALVEGTARKQK